MPQQKKRKATASHSGKKATGSSKKKGRAHQSTLAPESEPPKTPPEHDVVQIPEDPAPVTSFCQTNRANQLETLPPSAKKDP